MKLRSLSSLQRHWPAGRRSSGPAAAAQPLRVAVVMPSATTDMAFSQSMLEALQTVQKDMGGESAMEIKYSENMFKVPDAAAAIRDYASQGFDIVIAHGSQYGSSVQEIAKDFPKTTFAWGTDVNTFGLPNVLRLHGGGRRGRLRQRRAGGHADQDQADRRDRPGGSRRCQDLHRRLHPGCRRRSIRPSRSTRPGPARSRTWR